MTTVPQRMWALFINISACIIHRYKDVQRSARSTLLWCYVWKRKVFKEPMWVDEVVKNGCVVVVGERRIHEDELRMRPERSLNGWPFTVQFFQLRSPNYPPESWPSTRPLILLNALAFLRYLLMPNLVSLLNETPQWHHAVILT